MRYAGLDINLLIMHQVVQKVAGAGEPILSDTPAPMGEADRVFMQERIRAALGNHARPITEDDSEPQTPKLVKEFLLASADHLTDFSRQLAIKLQDCQHPISPGGIFLAAAATLDSEPALIVAKLEHERGVRARQTQLADGRTTFGVQLFRDLLFTTGSKVFKVALFARSGIIRGALNGVVVDRQLGGSTIAQYFMHAFLGCRFTERADVLTERFHDAVQTWINRLDDAEKKARYEVALLGTLQSNTPAISPNAFAANHLEVDDRDDFTSHLLASGVPMREFEKDQSLVRAKISRIKLDTESGVTLLAPPSTVVEGTVTIQNNEDLTSTVTVRDRVTKMSGQGIVPRARSNEAKA